MKLVETDSKEAKEKIFSVQNGRLPSPEVEKAVLGCREWTGKSSRGHRQDPGGHQPGSTSLDSISNHYRGKFPSSLNMLSVALSCCSYQMWAAEGDNIPPKLLRKKTHSVFSKLLTKIARNHYLCTYFVVLAL